METLEIRLLGGFSIRAGTPVPGLNTGRMQSLLAYLLLHREVPQQRQRLAFLFWPDSPEAQAQTNLRTLVHRLRRALPDSGHFLAVDGHTLHWREDAPYTLDVETFEAAAAEDAPLPLLRQAADLYTGDLLPGCYEAWIEPARERLRQLFVRALERAATHLEAQRDYPGALGYAQRWVRHDPLDEEGHRRLMRLHSLAGDRAGALRAYRQCASTLIEELGVEPDTATRALHSRLLRAGALDVGSPGPRTVPVPGLPLVGREGEWRWLRQAWSDILAGPPRLAIISGEAGIGKTRLAEEFAAWVGGQGYDTAWGRAFPTRGGPAYTVIVPWVKAGLRRGAEQPLDPLWLSEVARIVPELLTQDPALHSSTPIVDAWQRSRFFEALSRAALLGGGPLLLVLDDIQWCEGETLAWLQHLLHAERRARLLVLATRRSDEVAADAALAALLLAFRRSEQLMEIDLGPLDAEQSARLAAEASGTADPAPDRAVYEAAEGNPLFIVETVRYHLARRAQVPAAAEFSPRAGSSPLPPTIKAVIAARLAQLTPAARAVAACAAVVGRHSSLEVLASVGQFAERILERGTDELCLRKVLVERGVDEFDFTHPMLREVAYAELGPVRRRSLHRRAMEALAATEPDPGCISSDLAAHAEQAGITEAAMRHHLAAARRAHHVGATGDATASLRRALSLFTARSRPSAAEQALATDLRELLGDLLYLTGQYQESRQTYEHALRGAAEPVRRSRLQRKLGKALGGQRDYPAALRAFGAAEDLLARGAGAGPEEQCERLQIQLDRLSVLYWTGDCVEMEEVHRRIGSSLATCGTPRQRREHAQSILLIRLRRDRYRISEDTLALARRSVTESLAEGHVPGLAVVRFRLAFALLCHGSLEEAREEATRALELTELPLRGVPPRRSPMM
jgi:DNA-binding SARP family transcriptional activator